MVVRQFKCPICGAEGKISVKGDSFGYEDISNCPICAALLIEDDDEEELDE